MKIKEIREVKTFWVETDESEYCEYQRRSADCWEQPMGESMETLYDCEDIEKAFQDYLLKEGQKDK